MLTSEIIAKFDEACSRGLCSGKGSQDGQMCIEAAVCYALGLPHGDDPQCVEPAIRSFKISLNDANWSSPQSRATNLRNLGIAQIGSKGAVDGTLFMKRMAEETIKRIIPTLFQEVFPNNAACLAAAERCEKEGTSAAADAARAVTHAAARAAARAAASDASYAVAAAAAAYAVDAAAASSYAVDDAAAAAHAAHAATNAVTTVKDDKYLIMSATIALEVLKELNSPGCKLI